MQTAWAFPLGYGTPRLPIHTGHPGTARSPETLPQPLHPTLAAQEDTDPPHKVKHAGLYDVKDFTANHYRNRNPQR